MENIEQLLRDYGYPEEAIPDLLKEISNLGYEKAEQMIMPYHDITADRSSNPNRRP
ncbi:hypothetical protein [Bacillus sp. V3-13]|uniref:hypothetical protein n=1 Tax=Bacillus sp. V3-13 TaxID=2053728 RepID=UPI0015E12958|nr:hypothetical protein [Bacillus sp. V3-13]